MQLPKNIFLSIFILITLSLAGPQIVYSQVAVRGGRIVGKQQTSILFISQSIDLNSKTTIRAQVGSPGSSLASGNFSVDALGLPLSSSDLNLLSLLSITPQYRNDINSTLLVAEKQKFSEQWISDSRGNLIANLRTAMVRSGVGSAWFNFSQEVSVSTPIAPFSKTVKLFWTLSLDKTSEPIWSKVQVIDNDPLIMHVIYTPLKLASGLPSNWQSAFSSRSLPGYLQYRLLDKQGIQVQGWQAYQYNGVFDEPDPSSTVGVDPEASLKCLVNTIRTDVLCNASMKNYADIKTLLSQNGAAYAYLKYSRKIEPVYDTVAIPGTNPVAYKHVARFSQEVIERKVSPGADCSSMDYMNKGSFGFELIDNANLYLVQNTGAYQGLGPVPPVTYVVVANDPAHPDIKPQAYQVNRNVTRASLNDGSLNSLIIDFDNPSGNMISINPLPSNIIMAASAVISVVPDGDVANNFKFASAYNTELKVNSSGGSQSEVVFGTSVFNTWSGSRPQGQIYDRSMSFDLTNPGSVTQFLLQRAIFDDWLSVAVNGIVAWVGPVEVVGNGADRLYQEYIDNGRGGYYFNGIRWGAGDGQIRSDAELYTFRTNYPNVDLRPFLRTGSNTIDVRTIVAGGGEGETRYLIRGCN